MKRLMRCVYCGILQDEPAGAKTCLRCGGELVFETPPPPGDKDSYIQAQLELDQVQAPAGQNIERHLLLTLRTPDQVPASQKAKTITGRPPLGFTAILDVSGSMHGEKLLQAKESLRQALQHLQDGDSLALVIFNDNVRCVLEPTPLNSSARRLVESALQEITASGMTALCGGLELGIEKALLQHKETNLALLLSDGQANVGDTDLETVGARGLRARQKRITISTLGIGSDYNEALMAEIATQGGGRFYHVQQADEISAYLTGELGELANLAGRDVHAQINVLPGVALMPISAAYPTRQEGEQVGITVGALPAVLELEILVRIITTAQIAGTKLSFSGSITYLSPAGNSLTTTLNRVTLRITDQTDFKLRDGVVVPVVERAVAHMKASTVLGISRAMAKNPQEGNRQVVAEMDHLRAYAALLGEERAKQEAREVELKLNQMSAAPAAAKQAVAESLAFIRSSRKFGKKDKS